MCDAHPLFREDGSFDLGGVDVVVVRAKTRRAPPCRLDLFTSHDRQCFGLSRSVHVDESPSSAIWAAPFDGRFGRLHARDLGPWNTLAFEIQLVGRERGEDQET